MRGTSWSLRDSSSWLVRLRSILRIRGKDLNRRRRKKSKSGFENVCRISGLMRRSQRPISIKRLTIAQERNKELKPSSFSTRCSTQDAQQMMKAQVSFSSKCARTWPAYEGLCVGMYSSRLKPKAALHHQGRRQSSLRCSLAHKRARPYLVACKKSLYRRALLSSMNTLRSCLSTRLPRPLPNNNNVSIPKSSHAANAQSKFFI